MTLFEIQDCYKRVLDYIETEEYDDDMLLEAWEECEGDVKDKADGYIYTLKTLKLQEEALAEEIKRLQAKKKTLEKRQLRMKDVLTKVLKNLGYDKLKTDKFTLYSFKSDKLDVYDTVPDEYKIEYTAKKNDDKKIKEALLNGEQLPFARLIHSFTVR